MALGRALFGLIKGLLVGGGIGYCLLKLGNPSGMLVYLSCGIIGAVVGLLCGRAPWRAETIWTPILKALFGLGAGVGLYALGHRFLPATTAIAISGLTPSVPLQSGAFLAVAIGGLYGMFVELDDGGNAPAAKPRAKALLETDLND